MTFEDNTFSQNNPRLNLVLRSLIWLYFSRQPLPDSMVSDAHIHTWPQQKTRLFLRTCLLDWQLSDWINDWLIDWLTDWLSHKSTDSNWDWRTDGLTWLTDWLLADWLTGWLTALWSALRAINLHRSPVFSFLDSLLRNPAIERRCGREWQIKRTWLDIRL
jgi:hypothetical protein